MARTIPTAHKCRWIPVENVGPGHKPGVTYWKTAGHPGPGESVDVLFTNGDRIWIGHSVAEYEAPGNPAYWETRENATGGECVRFPVTLANGALNITHWMDLPDVPA